MTIDNKMLVHAKSSEVVTFADTNLTLPDMVHLFKDALMQNANLRELNLSNTSLEYTGVDLVNHLLSSKIPLQKLYLNDCQISPLLLQKLIATINKFGESLEEVSLENNPFDEASIRALMQLEQNNPNIKWKYTKKPIDRNPQDIYASPFEDASAMKGKYTETETDRAARARKKRDY